MRERNGFLHLFFSTWQETSELLNLHVSWQERYIWLLDLFFVEKWKRSDFSTCVLSKSEIQLTSRLTQDEKIDVFHFSTYTSREVRCISIFDKTQVEKSDLFHFSTKHKSRSQMYLFCQERCVFNSLEVSYQVDKNKCRKPFLSRKLTNCCREQQYIISHVEAL